MPLYRLGALPMGVASIIASGLSFWMSAQNSGAELSPGCGAKSGCAALAAGRWARWFGIPVGWFGGATYLTLAATSLLHPVIFVLSPAIATGTRNAQAVTALLAVTSGGWFFAIQTLAVRRMCWHCNVIHLFGVLVLIMMCIEGTMIWAIGPLVTAGAGLVILIAGQLIPRLWTNAVVRSEVKVESNALWASAYARAIPARISSLVGSTKPDLAVGRQVSLLGGKLILDAGEWPLLGRPDAKHIIALMFDYTCAPCRLMHRTVTAVVEAAPKNLGVLLLPVPQPRDCNRMVQESFPGHNYACQFARLGLEAWRQLADQHAHFYAYLSENEELPQLGPATRRLAALTGIDFDPNAFDPNLDTKIVMAVEIFERLQLEQIPMLLLPRAEARGQVDSLEHLRDILDDELSSTVPQ